MMYVIKILFLEFWKYLHGLRFTRTQKPTLINCENYDRIIRHKKLEIDLMMRNYRSIFREILEIWVSFPIYKSSEAIQSICEIYDPWFCYRLQYLKKKITRN